MVIEEFLEGGPEVDVDCLVQKGEIIFLCINENRPVTEPWFLETGGMTPPPSLSVEQQLELRVLCQNAVAMFGEKITAVIHFEAKFTPRGAFPIELNLRLGGAETYMMVKAVYKVDLIVEALKMHLGIQLRPEDFPNVIHNPPQVFGSSTNIVPKWTGLGCLTTLSQDEDLKDDPSCPAFQIFFKQGDTIKCAPAGNHYLGWLVAIGTSQEDAELQLARLCSKLHYTIVPLSPAPVT